ncbi:cellulose synthase subunit BcsC [Pirellulimonas nuda]|uniref:Cellulose synthase subunit BcsC n=1 Tax=Pirellulimonas nuda TaxID=2528009 RepID=A0A518D7R1_9BACT|nr:tetratricopeptide repeat protein [Pirellulimonas nuda]QDU87501.1 cellulose synthase subunit BcsC [Pirellulimonas nuda]
MKPANPRPTLLGLCAALTLAAAAGCNTVASQTNNAEGVRLYQQGAYHQAAGKFQQAIANTPDQPDGYYNLAASLHRSGIQQNRPEDLRQAEVVYNQCLERNPNYPECYRGLAVLLVDTDRRDAAFRLLNNWAAASPTDPEPRIELARLLEESGQPQQAKTQLVDALAIDVNNSRALAALGRIRDQEGDYQQALANYQRALAIDGSQTALAARIAQLQGASVTTPQMAAAPTGTRVSQGFQPTVKY